MELRIHTARTTKDLDSTVNDGTTLPKDPKKRRGQVRAMLQEAAATRLDDFFEFLIGEAREDLEGAPEGGSRLPVQAQMDGRDFARFPLDVGVGDEVLEPIDIVTGQDWLGFIGIAPPSFPIISAEQQFAEKLHAYTLPRGERTNTRTKDLIDMVLLIRGGKLDQKKTAAAVDSTFTRRATHKVPPHARSTASRVGGRVRCARKRMRHHHENGRGICQGERLRRLIEDIAGRGQGRPLDQDAIATMQ